jgi:hypothetical protein
VGHDLYRWFELAGAGIIQPKMPAEGQEKSTLTEDLYQREDASGESQDELRKPEGQPTPVFVKKESERDIETWTAPARPFKRRDKQFWITTIAMAGVVGLVLFLVEGFMPVILIVSIVFLFYVLSTVEPENIEYKVTNRGIKIAGKLTEWGNMGRFWMSRRFDSELMIVEIFTLPGRLELVMDPSKKDLIQKAVSEYLAYEEVAPLGLDRAANWFGKRMPGGK